MINPGITEFTVGDRKITQKTLYQRVKPDDLPRLLARLDRRQTTKFALIGSSIKLSSLPDDLPEKLQGYIVFQLTGDLPNLPRELLRLDCLQALTLWALHLEDNDVTEIAEKFCQLTVLDLSINKISDIGVQAIFSNFTQLVSLDLGNRVETNSSGHWMSRYPGNRISATGMRAIAGHLSQLSSLYLDHMNVADDTVQVITEHLGQLTYLDLSASRLSDIAVQTIATGLNQLTYLDLSDSRLSDIAVQTIATGLNQLTYLDLHNNNVGDEGAFAIAKHLNQLTSLNLGNNNVGDEGAFAIAKHLNQLTSLNLGNNNVGDEGAFAIAKHLNQLTSLNLGNYNVDSENTSAIAEYFNQLTSLNLGNYNVGSEDTSAIAEHLDRSTSRKLDNNQIGITAAQAIAEHLGQLTELRLDNNNLGDEGACIIAEHLSQLNMLSLANNKVGDVGVYAIAKHLGQLTELYLELNDFSDEAVVAIGENLTGLVALDINSNKEITTVAPLKSLQLSWLNISNTQVTDLSPLKSLILSGVPVGTDLSWVGQGIFVKNCPLRHPSPEVVAQGVKSVLNYFREIEAQGVDRLFEAKLLIVGEGGAGKTSIIRRMFLPGMELPTEDETTRGIDIHHHEFPITNGRTFRLNAWDFGGQQIYHATHQFFLTKRSLYVLVDDTRSDNKSIHDEGFKFWLEVVETLSESSPLLIFQNEKGGRSKQIDEAGIKGRFPNVREVYRGNLEQPGAADNLRQGIEFFAQQLPHIGEDVPAKWVPIRKDLEDLAQSLPFISLDEYFEIYARQLELDRDKALHLSQYLHDLGAFLHFQQHRELRRTIFLQNHWVTEAVFRILDDEQVKAHRGRFTLTDCDRLWANQGYAEKEVELRALMIRFELSYQLPDTKEETWLAPQHLSPSKPQELSDWARMGDLILTYRYEFLPRGLVSRLIVRMHRFVKQPDLCWVSGALFEHGGTQVLVETSVRGNEIVLRSRGSEQQALLSVIASDLDALNDGFQGLKNKVGKWVPCICNTCRNLTEPAMFDQKDLIDRKSRKKSTIECPKPPDYSDVSVLELLDGMNLEQWLKRAGKELSADEVELDQSDPQGGEDNKTIRIFLASSAELHEDRDAFDLYFRQQNDRLRKEGLYLEILRWENFLDAMSETRLQDEYNKAIQNCDIFVSLFRTKTGKYTAEEFNVAWQKFKATGKPNIYTYFQKAAVSTNAGNRKDLMSLWDFQEKLKELGHFHTEYESVEDLKMQFRDQLDKLRDDSRL